MAAPVRWLDDDAIGLDEDDDSADDSMLDCELPHWELSPPLPSGEQRELRIALDSFVVCKFIVLVVFVFVFVFIVDGWLLLFGLLLVFS